MGPNVNSKSKITDITECKSFSISSPFLVESRKKAKIIDININNIFDPFLPDKFEKNNVKVTNTPPYLIPINHDLEGLYNYFTTPTIRHKIIHPFYLLGKFKEAIKLKYDSSRIKNTDIKEIFI